MDLKDTMKGAANDSIAEAVSIMFSADPVIKEKEEFCSNECEVISTIGFAGRLEGNIDILLRQKDAMYVVSQMLSMDITELSKDVFDGIGELLNVIAGGIKNRLGGQNYNFDINIPTAVQGKDLRVIASADTSVLKYEVQCQAFCFGVIITYKIHEEGKALSKFLQKKASAVQGEDFLRDMIAKDKK